ncbi:MAG: alpha/beta hydrolase [Clostridia bacterium]|nr:alpha/beta hydrolase [Clostridia bacterium]
MKFTEMGNMQGKTLLLLPGTACTWEINFHTVIDRLAEDYHLICVDYDGFDGDNSKPFTDMITVTEKIEAYIQEKHAGRVDGAYGSSLGGSFVGLLIQRKRIHIDHGFIGSSDLDQGSPMVARIMTWIVGRWIGDAAKSEKKQKKLEDMLTKNFGMDMDAETSAFMGEFARSMVHLHPKTVAREFYSDYVTKLEDDIHVEGTTVHVIYALKMGPKYEQRYLRHFRNPDIHRFDMQHEAWIFQKAWTQPILDMIAECMAREG